MDVVFKITWMSERGKICTDTGRATVEQIKEWNEAVAKAVAEGDEKTEIRVPTEGDSDWSDGTVRAILVKEIVPKVQRPKDW